MEEKSPNNSIFHANPFSVLNESIPSSSEEGPEEPQFDWSFMMPGIEGMEESFDTLFNSMQSGLETVTPEDYFQTELEIGPEAMDALADFFGEGKQNVEHKKSVLPPGNLKLHRMPENKDDHSYEIGFAGAHIEVLHGKVWAHTHDRHVMIGKAKPSANGFKHFIRPHSWIDDAVILSEEAHVKGTGLGYSSLIHSAACLAMMGKGSVLEPIEGFDVYTPEGSIEITGVNWEIRQSTAQIVIGKYKLFDAIGYKDQEQIEMAKLARKEETYDTSAFRNSSFMQPESPYTKIVDKFFEIEKHVKMSHYKEMYKFASSWMSRQPNMRPEPTEFDIDTTALDNVLMEFSKDYDGNHMLPSPFRTYAGKSGNPDIMYGLRVEVDLSRPASPTSFRTTPVGTDLESILWKDAPYKVSLPAGIQGHNLRTAFEHMLKKKLFQNVYIESELTSKIQGYAGRFWSIHSRVGIAWRKTKSGSLTYYCAYYRIGCPDLDAGLWRLYDQDHNVWLSPTWKITVQQIHYAKTLPYKFYALISTIPAYASKREQTYVYQKFNLVLSVLYRSTWQTSHLAADIRFLTLCAMSGTGDLKAMFAKIPTKVKKYLSFPDAMLIQLFAKSAARIRNTNGKLVRTPLLDLPFRFVAIEKDLTQGMSWHMREADHATQCMAKVVKGIAQEQEYRDQRINSLIKQLEFLMDSFRRNKTQDDFDELMQQMPDVPYYNHILFCGMAWKSAEKLHAGKRQRPTPVRLSGLISDHNATVVEEKGGQIVVSSKRVAEGFVECMEEYNNPGGIHQLIWRMSTGKEIPLIFAIHPKDSRDKNREIPQMSNKMRVLQFVSESLVTIYTDAEDADMMQKSQKYQMFVKNFSAALRKGGLSRSEDKSFFCGNMHPEFMSLATLVIAKVTHTCALVTAAALQRTDACRKTIIPYDADPQLVPNEYHAGTVIMIRQGKKKELPMMNNYIHMMQGVRALGAALVNTAFSTGVDECTKEMIEEIEASHIYLTSDDSARVAWVKKGFEATKKSALEDYAEIGPRMVKHMMMKDSAGKAIRSTRLAEFNNMATGPYGAFAQCFPHAFLCVQPLIGDSIISDIISVTANARMSLLWGDTPDMARAAFAGNVVMLTQKWLINQEQLQELYRMGFFPRNDEELLGGFFIRNDETMKLLLSGLDDSMLEAVIRGETSVTSVLSRFRITIKKPKRAYLIKHKIQNPTVLRTLKLINMSRKLKGRMSSAYLRPISHKRRELIRTDLFSFLRLTNAVVDEQRLMVLRMMPKPPLVTFRLTMPRSEDRLPATQGEYAMVTRRYNVKGIIAMRLLGINVSQKLDDQELDIAGMSQDEYDMWLLQRNRMSGYRGIQHKSPCGRPLVRMHNDVWFTRPRVFGFMIDLPRSYQASYGFTTQGTRYSNVQQCFIGGNSLRIMNRDKLIPAFGWAKVGDEMVVWYQLRKAPVKTLKVKWEHKKSVRIRTRKGTIYVRIKPDYSPIIEGLYGVIYEIPVRNHIIGDATARMNYGSWFNSSTSSGCNYMRRIFSHFGATFPVTFDSRRVTYPHFPEAATEIQACATNILVGSRSACYLKLVPCENAVGEQMISLHTRRPHPILIEEAMESSEEE